ncbi:MAG: FAD-dependent oxidoreductase [Oligoflexia bacterium]|nr:FAD-dependent oxidoreductase [Oligoflexia bacterium]
MTPNSQTIKTDILLVGAGVIGSGVAMHLGQLGRPAPGDIRVIDFDLEGSLSSSELNAGGVRGTWSQPVNVKMARLTIDWLAENAEAAGYRDVGYLWLKTPESMPAALVERDRQIESGWPVEAWDVAELKKRVPFIDKTADLAGAIFGPRDGLVNPNGVKNLLRERARASGVVFDDRSLLKAAERDESGGWLLKVERYPAQISDSDRLAVLSGGQSSVTPQTVYYQAKRVVNCAGPWAAGVAKILGYESPVYPTRRQISVFDSRGLESPKFGMIVDTSGVYFHPEATHILAGFANNNEPHGIRYDYDGEGFFTESIWAPLYERASVFENLKHVTGWAGQYEVSPDESAVIGEVSAPGFHVRAFEAHSFSGHGVMHAYAAGLALAELMLKGRYLTIDAGMLSGARFATGALVRETAII